MVFVGTPIKECTELGIKITNYLRQQIQMCLYMNARSNPDNYYEAVVLLALQAVITVAIFSILEPLFVVSVESLPSVLSLVHPLAYAVGFVWSVSFVRWSGVLERRVVAGEN
jgi:hypothetical protein